MVKGYVSSLMKKALELAEQQFPDIEQLVEALNPFIRAFKKILRDAMSVKNPEDKLLELKECYDFIEWLAKYNLSFEFLWVSICGQHIAKLFTK